MEIQIKRAVRAGNSSAVILPRAWLNRDVRVELIRKTPEEILLDVISILGKIIDIKEIVGVYLTGSYARGEEDEESDIDILVITKNIDREMISEGVYNILVVSLDLLKHKLKEDLFPVGQMIREARPLLNADYLDSIDVHVTERNVDWYIKTTEDKLKLIAQILDKLESEKRVSNRVAYTLVLRIKTLHIIKKILENKEYSKKEFEKLIERVSGGKEAYEAYLAVKSNKERKKGISIREAHMLRIYLENELKKVTKMLKTSS